MSTVAVVIRIILLSLGLLTTNADISNQNPPDGACLCLDANSVNVRDAACGSVIGVTNSGMCYTYKGQKIGCTLSGTFYQFFEIDFDGRSGWIAGNYLNVGSDSLCGSVSEPDQEFRSLFIATAWNVDWPRSSADTVANQQQQMLNYLNMMSNTNMNAVVFQVRPVGDAMYYSEIEPWSRFLTGTQGTAPSPFWDPLSFMITEAHARGIEVHAWLNPYRANLSPNWDGLAANHMANRYRQYAYPYSTYLWMDPGAQIVVEHLISVIQDIINRYDVDGIHFDDYFYPYPDGTQFPDSATYNAYVGEGGTLSRDDWRRDNVNRMVQRVYQIVHNTRASVKFSISPFGIYRPGNAAGMPSPITGLDPYSQLYADSKLWLQSGWVDFFAPQLYWAITPPAQSYPVLLDWWLDANTANRHIYAANGVYKIDDSNNWPVSEIENQIALSRESIRRTKLSLGNVMYSAKYFRDNTKSITDAFRTRVYTKKAITPPMSWMLLEVPLAPIDLHVDDNGVLTWRAADQLVRWWIVMRRTTEDWSIYAILPASNTTIKLEENHQLPYYHSYSIRALNSASLSSSSAIWQL